MANIVATEDEKSDALSSLNKLYKSCLSPILKDYAKSANNWGISSHEARVFDTILKECKDVLIYDVEYVIQIFKTILEPNEEKDKDNYRADMKLKFFMMLSRSLIMDTESKGGIYDEYAYCLIKELICPSLKWSAGRRAEAVRTAAASSLFSIMESGNVKGDEIKKFADETELFQRMNSLLEDDSGKIRSFIVQTYEQIFKIKAMHFTHVLKICTRKLLHNN